MGRASLAVEVEDRDQDKVKQGNGKIINISSLQGFLGRPGDAVYATSKAAVNLMTMSMACEWAKNGIRVNAIAPTWCRTDLTSPKLRIDSFYNKLKQRIPIGRAGNRDDIFGIVVFLASEASDFVNGAVIPLDGGATASDGFPPVPMRVRPNQATAGRHKQQNNAHGKSCGLLQA